MIGVRCLDDDVKLDQRYQAVVIKNKFTVCAKFIDLKKKYCYMNAYK